MANAPRTPSRIPVTLGLLASDMKTPAVLVVNPSTHVLQVSDGTTSVASGSVPQDIFDGNRIPVSFGVSSTDLVTILPFLVDGSGNLYIDSA
ncbi:MAG: hypothetical protein KGJ89_05275 [Patescibacteria group bacterium]|nr:hypothetical protein [Patescibacteria group bacterium]